VSRGRTIAVTLGDPRGIGPEVTFRAAGMLLDEAPDADLAFFGPEGMELPGEFRGTVPYHGVGPWDGTEEGAGRVSVDAIRQATSAALDGEIGAVVTAPVHKPALHAAGYPVPGQTELLQDLTGSAEVGMLMVAERTRSGGALRVLLATTHIALEDVPDRVTQRLLVDQTALLDRALRTGWEIENPRIGVCALNPHASDRGLFGDQEDRVYRPALDALRDSGVLVVGPVPADTVFRRALDGEFDAVVAPYHDVGMAAFKTVSFGGGVNTTLGLPFPRTSPDHGTAFDLAGSGRADPSSMLEALRLARRLAGRRFDTPQREA